MPLCLVGYVRMKLNAIVVYTHHSNGGFPRAARAKVNVYFIILYYIIV